MRKKTDRALAIAGGKSAIDAGKGETERDKSWFNQNALSSFLESLKEEEIQENQYNDDESALARVEGTKRCATACVTK